MRVPLRSFYTGTPVLPFGFGLSYTTWTYTPFNPGAATPGTTLDLSAVRAAAEAQVRLCVKPSVL